LRSRRSGPDNNRRRHRRTHRPLQVHQLNPVLQHNSRRERQGNQAHQCRERPVNSHLPVFRRVHQECHRSDPLALPPQDQLLRVQPLPRR
jgi:hypothetical protein